MQRTGGTALTNLLMEMSEYPKAEHEPFNWDKDKPRQFWPIAQAWENTGNATALVRSLKEVLSRNVLIKHCYELPRSILFNSHLLTAAATMPYRHVHLLRRDETSRLISRYIAEAEGTWFKDWASVVFEKVANGQRNLKPLPVNKIIDHYHLCKRSVATMSQLLVTSKVNYTDIYYEDIYTGGHDDGVRRVVELMRFLGFSPDEIDAHRVAIGDMILNSGQNTRSVRSFVPNLNEAIRALAAAGCPPSPEWTLVPEPATPRQGRPPGSESPGDRVPGNDGRISPRGGV
jgi:hypothetical protein